MNYQQVYINLMERAKIRGWSKKTAPCYVESHHIVPRWAGGANTKENLVCLTAREHFVAHKLLYKADSCEEAVYAYIALCRMTPVKAKNKVFKVSSRDFNTARQLAAQASRKRMLERNPSKGRSGILSPLFTGYYHTPAGVFTDIYTAAKANKIGKSSIARRCKNSEKIVTADRLGKDACGKTWRELGFWFEEVKNVSF